MDDLFLFNEHNYAEVRQNKNFNNEIHDIISRNKDVKAYCERYDKAFGDYHKYLFTGLVQHMFDCKIQQKHEELTNDLFSRLEPFNNLADKYQAYQFFSNEWKQIQTDLEIIQTEGKDAFREIEIDDETNKENGKLIPFDIVQKKLLPWMLSDIKQLEDDLSANTEQLAEIFESLTEEEKEKYANDDNTDFAPKKFPKFKRGQEFAEETIEYRLQKVNNLYDEAKKIKKSISEQQRELLERTRETILKIGLDTATQLMDAKWTEPLCNSLARMPEEVIQTLADIVQHLSDKYSVTYQDISNRIQSAENSLYKLLGELEGNAADNLGLDKFRTTLNNTK